MSAYSIATIDPLVVLTFEGFNLPDDIAVVPILSDGSSTHNAVLQSSGTGLPQANVIGVSFTLAEVASLRALRQAETPIGFVEPEGTHTVVILSFRVDQNHGGLERPWSMVLVELPDEGS